MIYSELPNSFSFKTSSLASDEILHSGLWLVLVGIDEIPPHIALISSGKYYSLSTRKVDCGSPLERFLNTLKRKRVSSLFINMESKGVNNVIARNEAISVNLLLENIYKNLQPLKSTENTCLSPIKEFFTSYYSAEFASVNYVFELLALSEGKGLIKKCVSLFPIDNDAKSITLPKYSMEQIKNSIKKLTSTPIMKKYVDSFENFMTKHTDVSSTLWLNFKKLYITELENESVDKFKKIYENYAIPSIRTDLNAKIIEKIAKELELEVLREVLKIDFALSNNNSTHGYPVPLIFVEHENDINSDPRNHEISKLCFTYSPLKVFITWINGNWETEREKHTDDDWWYMIASCMEIYGSLPGTLGLIIGEVNTDGTIRYFSEVWSESYDWDDEKKNKGAFITEGKMFECKLQ